MLLPVLIHAEISLTRALVKHYLSILCEPLSSSFAKLPHKLHLMLFLHSL